MSTRVGINGFGRIGRDVLRAALGRAGLEVDFVADVERETSKAEVNEAFRKAAEGALRGILAYSEEPLVSVDFNRNPHSAIVDASLTNVVDKRLVKVIAWYDNEWGYACRVCDLIAYIGPR